MDKSGGSTPASKLFLGDGWVTGGGWEPPVVDPPHVRLARFRDGLEDAGVDPRDCIFQISEAEFVELCRWINPTRPVGKLARVRGSYVAPGRPWVRLTPGRLIAIERATFVDLEAVQAQEQQPGPSLDGPRTADHD